MTLLEDLRERVQKAQDSQKDKKEAALTIIKENIEHLAKKAADRGELSCTIQIPNAWLVGLLPCSEAQVIFEVAKYLQEQGIFTSCHPCGTNRGISLDWQTEKG